MLSIFAAAKLSASRAFASSGIGLTICDTTLTISAVRRSVSRWSRTLPRDPERPIDVQISAALDLVPHDHRRLRRRVTVAVGGPAAQVKCLVGVPSAATAVLRAVVAA